MCYVQSYKLIGRAIQVVLLRLLMRLSINTGSSWPSSTRLLLALVFMASIFSISSGYNALAKIEVAIATKEQVGAIRIVTTLHVLAILHLQVHIQTYYY